MTLTFRTRKVAALAVCLAVIAACSREQQDWRSAEAADTVESYGQFLKSHADSELAVEARTRIAQLAEDRQWQQAGQANTAEAYRQFLARYPNGKWTQEARIRMQNFALNELPAQQAAITPAARTPPSLATAYVSIPRAPDEAVSDVSPASGISGTSVAGGTNGYAIQLGAFASEPAAAHAWQQLTTRFSQELQGLTPHVLPADTLSGSLFRLQARVADEPQARALCDMLKKQDQPCVPVLPK